MKKLFLDKFKNKLKNIDHHLRWKTLAKNKQFDPLNALLVLGDPRGGSTWMTEILKQIPYTEILWEPLWLSQEPTFRKLGFSYRQFLEEDFQDEIIRNTFEKLFRGEVLNNYICQKSNPIAFKNAENLLIKFCRANQLLPWITKNFLFKFSPVYIVRHPCAVIASQLNHGAWRNISPKINTDNNRLFAEFEMKHLKYIESIDTIEKRLAFYWALCNSVPLKHGKNNIDWITINYENLIIDGKNQLKRIEKKWGVKLPPESYSMLKKPSHTARNDSPIRSGDGFQLNYWKSELSQIQVNNILEVLEYFEIDTYSEEIMPVKTKIS